MSVEYCEKHHQYYDTDFTTCDGCENEVDEPNKHRSSTEVVEGDKHGRLFINEKRLFSRKNVKDQINALLAMKIKKNQKKEMKKRNNIINEWLEINGNKETEYQTAIMMSVLSIEMFIDKVEKSGFDKQEIKHVKGAIYRLNEVSVDLCDKLFKK